MPSSSGGPDILVWTQSGKTDTNLLMSTGFAIISNFAAAVPLPSKAAPPQSVAQLRKCLLGSPKSPADISFWGTNGCSYHVGGGFVNNFDCPESYFHFEDPNRLSRFEGSSILTEKQAVEIASNAVRRLAKVPDQWKTGPPKVERPYNADRIPFFLVVWADTGTDHGRIEIEIDGRTRKAVSFSTTSSIFYDSAFFRDMQSRAYTPEPSKPAAKVNLIEKFHYPQPTTNYVQEAITSWLSLCKGLGVDPGNQTNLCDVDWGRTLLYTNENLSLTLPVCTVSFTNGAFFQSIGGTAFSHFAADAYYAGEWAQQPRGERAHFRGNILKYEEDLAADLERKLVEKLGFPAAALASLSPGLDNKRGVAQARLGLAVGSVGFKRDELEWRDWPRFAGRAVRKSETKNFFSAEFDLETGELKSIYFRDRGLVEAVTHLSLPALDRNEPINPTETRALGTAEPETNQVQQAICSWLLLCRQLGVKPGPQTNLCDVKWEATAFRTNSSPPLLQVAFTNGAFFLSRGPTVTWFCAQDAFWARMKPENRWWEAPSGLVTRRWELLAKELERALTEHVGLNKEDLAPYQCFANPVTPPEPGTKGETRAYVEWKKPSASASPPGRLQSPNTAFDAEFDLGSGELKSLHFTDSKLIEALVRANEKHKSEHAAQ
jgi:hypothetical protein